MKRAKNRLLLIAFVCVLIAVFTIGLAACNAAKYTLKFDAGEGVTVPDIVAEAGAAITPPSDPKKEGFEFDGWYLDSNGQGEKQSIPAVMPGENVTYYAKWTALPQITLSLEGGSFSGGQLYLKAGSDLYAFMQQLTPPT